ncbi:cyanoexosortase A [Chroococcidiopsis sp. CCMEE 29]|uniref:cyanoexosortase A n=1 Tax=Chroococcidiopsis sp. CCMEE 29 TaxID=155894 RepID=UPI002020C411|nr:cyanoexosortase A [Chroococcidiopsis sp. CCMEE 29]
MKVFKLCSFQTLKSSKFLLLGVAAGLIAIHLTITWKSDNTDLWGLSILFLAAVCSLIWKKRNTLNLETGIISSFLGTLIIAFVLFKITSPIGKFPDAIDKFHYVLPLISSVGLGLIASGFKGLKQYSQELTILFFLGVPQATIPSLTDISIFTAKFATAVLWYLGFEVSRQGVNVILPTGSVEVYSGCSGMVAILYLWGLAALFLVMFPIGWSKKILVPIVATLLAFAINGGRVALMAVLAASSNKSAFDYWHTGNGSQIFAMTSVIIFGLFCFCLLQLNEAKNDDFVEF